VQHKLTIIWKRPYRVDKVFGNHTLRVNSLINGTQFAHTSPGRARTRYCKRRKAYKPPPISTIELVVDKYGLLSKRKDNWRTMCFDKMAWV
jgi:hypothetical protein